MTQSNQRMIDVMQKPTIEMVSEFIGKDEFRHWTAITKFIEDNYAGLYNTNDWIFGGKEFGWGLRFKKTKLLCTLIPEKGRLLIQIVLTRSDRVEVEKILSELSPALREKINNTKIVRDGKWLGIVLDENIVLDDIKKLLVIKFSPENIVEPPSIFTSRFINR